MIHKQLMKAFQDAIGKPLNPQAARDGVIGFQRFKGEWQFVCWPIGEDFEPNYSTMPTSLANMDSEELSQLMVADPELLIRLVTKILSGEPVKNDVTTRRRGMIQRMVERRGSVSKSKVVEMISQQWHCSPAIVMDDLSELINTGQLKESNWFVYPAMEGSINTEQPRKQVQQ